MNWYLQSGKESDVVLSTRIRFARNLINYPFSTKLTKEEAIELIDKIEQCNIGFDLKLFKLSDMDGITKMSLVEKHILSPEFVLNDNESRAILINDEENICIMINEEDHLRIQVLGAGLDLDNILNVIYEIDRKLEEILEYAFDAKYGFLTTCPTNVGTGMRASVMVHLPALSMTGNINKVLEVVNGFGMNIRGIYGEGSQSQGNVYQISNKSSLGISEEETIKNLNVITEKIIEQERLARKYLAKNSIELEDKVYRSFGILANAKKMSSVECNNLLSNIRLGTDLGIIEELTDLKVNKLELYSKPANLQKYLDKTLDDYERDIQRAYIIKQIIKED